MWASGDVLVNRLGHISTRTRHGFIVCHANNPSFKHKLRQPLVLYYTGHTAAESTGPVTDGQNKKIFSRHCCIRCWSPSSFRIVFECFLVASKQDVKSSMPMICYVNEVLYVFWPRMILWEYTSLHLMPAMHFEFEGDNCLGAGFNPGCCHDPLPLPVHPWYCTLMVDGNPPSRPSFCIGINDLVCNPGNRRGKRQNGSVDAQVQCLLRTLHVSSGADLIAGQSLSR